MDDDWNPKIRFSGELDETIPEALAEVIPFERPYAYKTDCEASEVLLSLFPIETIDAAQRAYDRLFEHVGRVVGHTLRNWSELNDGEKIMWIRVSVLNDTLV